MKNFKAICAIVMMVVALCGCERGQGEPGKDAGQTFIGDYTFVSTGDIDLYFGAVKVTSVPMNKEGEMSIAPAEKSNEVWMKAEGDSMRAYISGDTLFMEPATDTVTMAGIQMLMSFTYGKATLVNNQLSWPTDVDISATYKSMNVKGTGTVEIVATKKE